MFIPQSVDLTIYKGSTYEEDFVLTIGTEPFSLSGWTARMQVRESLDSTAKIFDLTSANGGIAIIHETNPDGTTKSYGYRISISAEQTAAVDIFGGVYDVELVDATGRVGRIMQGSVAFDPEVTR